MLSTLFGARAQVVVGSVCFVAGAAAWAFVEIVHAADLRAQPLVAAIFRVSMFFGLVACYAIVATGLGFRATERVEAHVDPEIDESAER